MDVLINQLQRIPVTGDNDALPAVVGTDFCHGADHVVGFPALTFVDRDVHGAQNILHHRHLLRQLLGHSMTVGLIALVFQMAEGGAVEVKGHADGLRLLLLLHPLQNVQKAVNSMGVQSIPGGQGTHAEEGTVDDAVAV